MKEVVVGNPKKNNKKPKILTSIPKNKCNLSINTSNKHMIPFTQKNNSTKECTKDHFPLESVKTHV